MRSQIRHAPAQLLGSLMAFTLALSILPAVHPAHAQDADKFEVYGFGHFDYIQDFKRVDPSWAATLRPSKIPTVHGAFGSDGQAILSARQSRLGAQANLPTDNGAVFVKFEIDLFGVGVDAGQTTIRPRHMYGQWKEWLGGQTNSAWMDIDLFPNVIDYWGPSGMVFLRNPQLRYQKMISDNELALAIEHPLGDIDAGQIRDIDPNLGANLKSDNKIPDFTGHFKINQPWGHFQLAGIVRRLGFETYGTPNNNPKGDKTGGGGDVTLVLSKPGKDKLMLGAVFGAGISNYMNDGGTDLAPTGTLAAPKAKAVPLQGYLAYLDHYWNPKLTTTVGYSRTQVQNTGLQSATAFKSGDYASVNFVYYPTKNVFFGLEGLWGRRTDKDGKAGEDARVQLSAHYSFSSLDFGR